MILFELIGEIFCFKKNLNASNKGCRNPIKETLLGPKRLWKSPIVLRSNKVKKATVRAIKIQWISQQINFIRQRMLIKALIVLKTIVLYCKLILLKRIKIKKWFKWSKKITYKHKRRSN